MENKASILIVDDSISLCKTMFFVLRRKGHAVATASNGPEAIEMVKEMPFDIVFMDIKMSPMDGVETYRNLKKIRPEAVVIMMTAYAVEDLVQKALREGAYGVIYKPMDMEKVLAVIKEAMEGQQGALILVVDDDNGIRITLKNILSKKGYQVAMAQTGEEAIKMVREKPCDVIFIDMKMPTLNGLETYLSIKAINPRAVAIMMTAYRQEMADLVEEALKNSAYACLHKPLDMTKVLALVDEIWERKQKANGNLQKEVRGDGGEKKNPDH